MGRGWNQNLRFETHVETAVCDAVYSVRYAYTDFSQKPNAPIIWVNKSMDSLMMATGSSSEKSIHSISTRLHGNTYQNSLS